MKLFYGWMIFVVVVFCGAASYARKKDKAPPVLWKKLVTRTIDTRFWLDNDGSMHKAELIDSSLMRWLVDAVEEGRIKAYIPDGRSEFDWTDASIVLSKEKLNKIILSTSDTDYEEDNTNGMATKMKIFHEPRFPSFRDSKITILENWSFDPLNRVTEIEIVAIGLRKETFRYGFYKGSQFTFWLKWNDIKGLLKTYRESHPEFNLQRCIWDDLFMYPDLVRDIQGEKTRFHQLCNGKFSAKGIAVVGVTDTFMKDIRSKHETDPHLEAAGQYQSVMKSIYSDIQNKRVIAYCDSGIRFEKRLSPSAIAMYTDPDTLSISSENMYDIIYNPVPWYYYDNYRVLETWVFDVDRGKITIKVNGLSPQLAQGVLDEAEYAATHTHYMQPFWVRYEDIKHNIAEYDALYPINNFTINLWRSFFRDRGTLK